MSGWPAQPGGFYRVRIGASWTVAQYMRPEEDEEPYWIVLGSEVGFATDDFAEIGHRVLMPESMVMVA